MIPLKSHNPMTGEVLWKGYEANEAGVDAAINKARDALENWSGFWLEEREAYLIAYSQILRQRKEALAVTISKETGKPLWESRTEVDAMIGKIDISIEAQKFRCPEKTVDLPQGVSVTRHKPIGIAAVFGPYNFPGHLPNGHIVPALLAGNTVVFKPSEQTPLVGEMMASLWEEAKLPKGVLNIVQGGPETGKILAQHLGIDALLFTGSWITGKHLADHFGKHPNKLLALEMGGNNPLIIGNISNIKAAVYNTILSAYITAGQRCTCARRLIVQNNSQGDEFLDLLIETIPKIIKGAYTDIPEPFMGPVINNGAAEKLLEAEEHLIQEGGRSLVKMERLKEGLPLLSPGLVDVTQITHIPDKEFFGPLLQVIRVSDLAQAAEVANATTYGLCASILSDNKEEYEQYYKKSRAGVVNWNVQTTGASSGAPFGGVGKSGNYRPSAYYAADYCNFPVASIESNLLKMPEKILPGLLL